MPIVGTDDSLAWERRRRPRAALAAFAAAVLILASYLATALAFSDAPRAGLLDAIGRAAEPGRIGGAPSAKVAFYEFYLDRTAALIAASAARAVGFVLIGLALTFLAYATLSRSDRFPRAALYVPVVGAVLSALSYLASPVGTVLAVRRFLDGPRTVDAAQDVTGSTVVTTSALIGFVGGLALALAFVLVCLHAMRVGLLTRFMGVLGILSGVLTFIPIGSPLPVVQCFWLGALGVLLLGRWPKGQPPAWNTGRAEPWPSQQQLREAREGRSSAEATPEPARQRRVEPVAAVPAGGGDRDRSTHPSSKKKKRKRRAS